jgi:hypothetical protein
MTFKRTSGLVAAIGLSVLLMPALAQQSREASRGRQASDDQNPSRAATLHREPFGLYTQPAPAAAAGAVLEWTPQPGTGGPRPDFYVTSYPATSEEANLAHQAEELARKLGDAAPETDKSKIKSQLTEILDRQFDLRQKRHLDEIKALEAKIKKLKDLVEKRQENRREIVAKRIDQIMSDAEGLGW